MVTSMAKPAKASWIEPHLRSLLRIVVGFTFSLHGYQKVFGIVGGHRFPINSLLGAAGVLETVGGFLIIIGLFTRPVAFLLSGEMAVAYFRTHAPQGLFPIQNGGEITVLYCFTYLWLSAAGAGPWSMDRIMGRKS